MYDMRVNPTSDGDAMRLRTLVIKANKKFDFLVVPGSNHGAGGAYHQRLLGIEPPDWNSRI